MFKIITFIKLAIELKKIVDDNLATVDEVTEQLANILERANMNEKYVKFLRNIIEGKKENGTN